MNKEELKHLHITIPTETYSDMMHSIQENQRFYRKGDIKRFIVSAIRNQIASGHAHSQYTHIFNSRGLDKERKRLNTMMQQINEFRVRRGRFRFEKGHQISLTELKEAISNVTGYHDSQNRALKKCLRDLDDNGYITNKKSTNPNVFLILNTGSEEDEFERQFDQTNNHGKGDAAKEEFNEKMKQLVSR
jgi:hypothetical protein